MNEHAYAKKVPNKTKIGSVYNVSTLVFCGTEMLWEPGYGKYTPVFEKTKVETLYIDYNPKAESQATIHTHEMEVFMAVPAKKDGCSRCRFANYGISSEILEKHGYTSSAYLCRLKNKFVYSEEGITCPYWEID